MTNPYDNKANEIAALYEWLKKEPDKSKRRLYLVGHGQKGFATMAGEKAKNIKRIIGKPPVGRLRLIVCYAARSKEGGEYDAADVRLANSKNSFASYLCQNIKDPNLEIHANYYIQAMQRFADMIAVKGVSYTEIVGDKKVKKVDEKRQQSIVIFKYVAGDVKVQTFWKTTGKYAAAEVKPWEEELY